MNGRPPIPFIGEGSGVALADVPSDPPPPPLDPQDNGGCERRFSETYPNHAPNLIQPKDFAFVPGGWTSAGSWTFHLFYIRQNQYLSDIATAKNLGHAVSNDLINWTILDTAAVRTRGGRFDSLHVWAPTVVLKGLTYYMFYTGVDQNNNQRIGLATSTDLTNWTQGDSVLTAQNISWASAAPSAYGGAAQLRDPYVMPDPDNPGDWLMYFVTVPTARDPDMVMGMAKSHGDLSTWTGALPFWSTVHHWRNDRTFLTESPHTFYRNGAWWLFNTLNGDSVWAESNAISPSDTTQAHWTAAQKLWTLVPLAQAGWFFYWHATEYLQMSAVNDIEYLAAFTDDVVGISYTQMRPAASPALFSMDCPSAAGVDDRGSITAPRLLLTGARPARSHVALRIELPARMQAAVSIYDVAGRKLRTLIESELPAGATNLSWDGRDRFGIALGSGVYFVGLAAQGGRQSVHVPLIR